MNVVAVNVEFHIERDAPTGDACEIEAPLFNRK